MNTNNKRASSPSTTPSSNRVQAGNAVPTGRAPLAPFNTDANPAASSSAPVVIVIHDSSPISSPSLSTAGSLDVEDRTPLDMPQPYYRSKAPSALPAGIAPAPRIDASVCLPGLFQLATSIWLRHLAACNATAEDVSNGDLPLVMLDGQIWW